jgi:aldose 1-epimerase
VSEPPSGEQFELAYGEQRAVVVEVGGGLRSYSVGAREVLDGYGVEQRSGGGRGQPLIPWPNRLRDGRYEWVGAVQQLDINEPSLGNAIHGLLRWRNWTVAERGPARVVVANVLHPLPGYPFTLAVEIAYELDERGLTVRTTARNAGVDDCPYGVGFHPYLRLAGSERIDAGLLTVPAATVLVSDERSIPTSRTPVAGGPFDFRVARVVGDCVLDTCFTDLERGSDGAARVVLAGADGAASTLWLDRAYGYVMLYSGDTLAPADRRRGLAVEPMSCAPNAFQSGDGLVRLAPGEEHVAVWGIEVR